MDQKEIFLIENIPYFAIGCVGYLQTCTDDGEKCCDSMTCDVNEFYPDQKWCVPCKYKIGIHDVAKEKMHSISVSDKT